MWCKSGAEPRKHTCSGLYSFPAAKTVPSCLGASGLLLGSSGEARTATERRVWRWARGARTPEATTVCITVHCIVAGRK